MYQMRSSTDSYLLVWNTAERIVGVFALEIKDQLSKLMVMAKLVDRILCIKSEQLNRAFDLKKFLTQSLPSNDGREISMWFPV